MKNLLSLALAGALLLGSTGCIVVIAEGDLSRMMDEHDAFPDLVDDLESCLNAPDYDLDLNATPWRTEAEWTIDYEDGSDGHAAFHRAKEAIVARIEKQGGHITEERETGPHAWECSFEGGDDGEASVRVLESSASGSGRMRIAWRQSN